MPLVRLLSEIQGPRPVFKKQYHKISNRTPGGLSRGQGGFKLSPKCQEFRDKHDKEGKGFLPKDMAYYMARITYKTLPEH